MAVSNQMVFWMDGIVSSKIALIQTPLLNQIMIIITSIGSMAVMTFLSVMTFSFLAYRKRWYDSALFAIGMLSGLGLELLIKIIFQRARPDNSLVQVSGYSFPSGHAVMAFIFFSLLIMLFRNDIKSKAWRITFIASCSSIILLVGLSRVYLNAHWFSDVMGGFMIGALWLAFVTIIFLKLMMKYNKSPTSTAGKTP